MKIKLWLFIVAIGLVFSACEKDDELRPPPHANAKANREAADFTSGNNNTTNDCILTDGVPDLVAGQHNVVGEVTVDIGDELITVIYRITEPGWCITETHLHVAIDPGLIPTNNPGNPMIGLFAYGDYHDCLSEFKYEIPREDIDPYLEYECYYVAAHAVVSGTADLEAFAGSLPETARIENLNDDYGDENALAYFPWVEMKNAGILDGRHKGWCVEIGVAWNVPEDSWVYSSLNAEDAGYDQEVFNKINWILNQDFVGQEIYTIADVQVAIWLLLYSEHDDDRDIFLPGIQGWDDDHVDEILEDANEQGSFKPGCDDVFAIILVPENDDAQDIIIEFRVPCYEGEETAWGDGCRFVDPGNWAMFFRVCEDAEP